MSADPTPASSAGSPADSAATTASRSQGGTTLRRSLGVPTLVLFGLAYMVPMTVFTTYGIVNAITEGKLALAYAVTLVAMLFTAVSYAFLAREIPSAGAAYTYTKAGFGRHAGFLTGWTIMIDYILLPMLNYLLIGLYLNEQFSGVPAWVFSMSALVLVTVLNIVGITVVKGANAVLVALQVVFFVIFFVLAVRAFRSDVSLLDPFIGGEVDLSLVFAGSAILCLSFLGFDAVSTMAEESKSPKRTVPVAIILTTVAGGLIFVLISWAAHLAFPEVITGDAADTAALVMLAEVGGDVLIALFLAAYVTGALGSALASQASVSRILYSMGRDGVLPRRVFGVLDRRFRTPVGAILVVAAVSVTAVWASVDFVASIVSFGALAAFSLVNLSVVSVCLLRPRRFTAGRVLLYGVVPVIGFGLTVWLWTSLTGLTLLLGIGWIVIGVIYLAALTRGFRQAPPSLDIDG